MSNSNNRAMKMNFKLPLLLTAALFLWSCTGRAPMPVAPVAEKIPVLLEMHGDVRTDNYYWMRLTDEQKSAEVPDDETRRVLDYLNAENSFKESVMKHTEPLQEKIFNELTGRIRKDDSTVPYLDNGYYYFVKYTEETEYPQYYRRKATDGAIDELLLDVNKLAEGQAYCQVSGLSVSPDNKILAYGLDLVSRRMYTIYFVDLATGQLLDEKIENTTGQTIWAGDSRNLFYVVRDPLTLRSFRVMRYQTAADGQSYEVYTEEDETFSVNVDKTKSREFILINSTQTLSTEVRIIDAMKPEAGYRVLEPRSSNHEYSADHLGGFFYISTNIGGASNFKLVKTPDDKTGSGNWTEVIPHRDDVLLQRIELFDNHIVASERINGLNNIRIIGISDASDHYIDFGEETYTAGIGVNTEPSSVVLRYGYSSLTTPSSVIDYNMLTKEKTVLKEEEILGGFDKQNYSSERLWVKAADGTSIPVSLVFRKGFVKNGKSPLLLYAYGSYGSSSDPSFRSGILSLLDRGFVYAIAHVRGGSELGRKWYEDGKLLTKINTFTDFNDCAQYLVDNKYTSPAGLFAQGGSAGGLLMGAIINMKPDLYRGVVAAVPFVDVVTTMLDATIPLTTFEWDEWGDPRQKEYYDYMLSYSPYDQVEAMDYPNLLVTTGYWDSQVQYWEPAKWVAKLREMKTDKNILIMDCNMTTGHGGASGRFERLKSTALQYAFMIDLAGIKE
jgi:oligopeptidase B